MDGEDKGDATVFFEREKNGDIWVFGVRSGECRSCRGGQRRRDDETGVEETGVAW